MTQERLAREINVASDLVSRWERGRTKPQTDNLAPLAKALGVTTDWILTGVGAGPSPLRRGAAEDRL